MIWFIGFLSGALTATLLLIVWCVWPSPEKMYTHQLNHQGHHNGIRAAGLKYG